MATQPLPNILIHQAAEAYRRLGTNGNRLIQGLNGKTFQSRVNAAIDRGMLLREERRTVPEGTPMPAQAEMQAWLVAHGYEQPQAPAPVTPVAQPAVAPKAAFDLVALRDALRKAPMTPDDVAQRFGISRARAEVALEDLQQQGLDVQEFGGRFSIGKAPPAPKHERGHELPVYTSRQDGTYKFGFTSDNHLSSKYSRLDVLNDLYDQFAAQGVDRVLNAGNWIDGEARFNMHDLLVHGMDAQLRYQAEHYPRRPGIVTYAVSGDDHEGWYAQKEGVDIGRYAQHVMRDSGRDDWVDMGYMEAYLRLTHAQSGKHTMLHLMHPGGGSAYAISYTVQKIVEAYDGGDKPAVLLAGHYHKLGYNIVRNVHCIQTGTTEDQTPFMRKKKLSAHVGGGICELRQDAVTGAITSCKVEFFTYFVTGYYANRWNMARDVQHADRGVA
jgi:biotin operon repressor